MTPIGEPATVLGLVLFVAVMGFALIGPLLLGLWWLNKKSR